jgi:hypothetical protein
VNIPLAREGEMPPSLGGWGVGKSAVKPAHSETTQVTLRD